jgi:hypothetical protein
MSTVTLCILFAILICLGLMDEGSEEEDNNNG